MTPPLLSLLLGAALAADGAEAARPPNLIVLLADDLGVHDVSVYGGAHVPTPHIDAIGAQGVRFEAAYAPSPVCSPSRAGLLTGRYPQRYGFELLPHARYVHGPLERFAARFFAVGDGWELAPQVPVPSREARALQGLPLTEQTLAELLHAQGYATGLMGKWHLGSGPTLLPERRGFDQVYGFYEAFSLYADPDRADVVNLPIDLYADRHMWRVGRDGASAIRRNGALIAEDRYLTDAIADEAVSFIDAHVDAPFLLYVPFNAPHAPLQALREDYEALWEVADPRQRVYAAMVRRLDEAVGRILAEIDARGLGEDTLVLLASDNGAAAYNHVIDNGPLAGGKLTPLEGGLRVPMLARWPGHLPAGQTFADPVSLLDVLPTLAEAAGAPLSTDRVYDGVSLLPYLSGRVQGAPHARLYWRSGGQIAVREGDWKLIEDAASGDRALYDLAEDPQETRDRSAEEPARVTALEAALRAWEADLVDPAWPPVMQYRYQHAGRMWIFPL